jgi:ubiquinone/menaquinone biosynthesis C-methylase UbiE
VGDAEKVLREICRILKPDGEMIIMGPTAGNVKELYAFNQRLYGVGMDIKTETRTHRLVAEFLPAAMRCFHQTTVRHLNGQLQFPDGMEFIKYYRSTLLYRESQQRFQKSFTDAEMAAHVQSPLVVTKQMVVIRASHKKV